MAEIWNTQPTVDRLLSEAKSGTERLVQAGLIPKLTVVRVGNHPASRVYVQKKVQMCQDLGFGSDHLQFEESISESELLATIIGLNNDKTVHGILVQLPLPDHVNAEKILNAIDPDKDVDGFHPVNVGRLSIGQDGLFPCTPMGVMELIRDAEPQLSGKHAVIVGRSNIVGKPMAQLLLQANCTVSILHSRTQNPQQLARQADIVVAAVGRPGLIDADWLKPGALVADVGINELTDADQVARFTAPDSKKRSAFERNGRVLYGDVNFDSAMQVAGKVTPVPGGVGPLTIAHLMVNCIRAAERSRHE